MEFTSYGGLIQGQSKEDFFRCSSMPGNRELMRVFKDVGLVEQPGSGMSRILRFYDRSIFKISDHFIKVIFPFSSLCERKNIAGGDENGDENLVLHLIKQYPEIMQDKMAEIMGISKNGIRYAMNRLKNRGILVRVGATKKGKWSIKK